MLNKRVLVEVVIDGNCLVYVTDFIPCMNYKSMEK